MTTAGYCGFGGIGGAFTDVSTAVPKQQVDGSYAPLRTPNRTGWVAVPPGQAGQVAVLGQIIGMFAQRGFLTAAEAFSVFAGPSQVRSGGGGPLTGLCLGITPGGSCGNNAIGDNFAGVMTGVAQANVDSQYGPSRTGSSRTGWVVVTSDAYEPLEVMVQLITTMWRQGKLTGSIPWDVFNKTTSVRYGTGLGRDDHVRGARLAHRGESHHRRQSIRHLQQRPRRPRQVAYIRRDE